MRRNARTKDDVRRVAATPEERRADCIALAAQDPQGRTPEFWERMMYPPGVDHYSGTCADGTRLAKDIAEGARPTLVRPGAAVADMTCSEDGPGVVVRVTADHCIVRFPAVGKVRSLTWWEVILDHVAPDPACLPAARPSVRRPRARKGGAACAV